MKKVFCVLGIFLFFGVCFAQQKITSVNLKLRDGAFTSDKVITTMKIGTKVRIEETGRYEVIDNIKSNWVKVKVLSGKSKDGKNIEGVSGWCFAGYLIDDGTWTSEDLENYLLTICKFKYKVSDSESRNEYFWTRFEKDHKYIEGMYERGEPTILNWKVLSPNKIEFLGLSPKTYIVSEISENSITIGDDVYYVDSNTISQKIIAKIPFFYSMDTSKLVDVGSTAEMYHFFDTRYYTSVIEDTEILDDPEKGNKNSWFMKGDIILISARTNEKYTIDGVTDYLYMGTCYEDIVPWSGWLFGGKLKGHFSIDAYYDFGAIIRCTLKEIDTQANKNFNETKKTEFKEGDTVTVTKDVLAYDKNESPISLLHGTKIQIIEILDSVSFNLFVNEIEYPYIVFEKFGNKYIVNSIYLK